MSPRPLILLEFNELSIPLMDRFIAAGHLPNFARLRAESTAYVTDAGEDPPNLNPWIQWVTLHTGKPYSEHGVFHLGDAASKKVPMIWDAVSAKGHKSWVCGSMNVAVQPGFKGCLLPDPWDASSRAQPEAFEKYMKVVRSYVFEHTSGKRPVTLGTLAQFLGFMATHGLRIKTVAAIVRQLVEERFANTSWKRASVLDWLQFDLFRSVYRRERPLLATLFFNSTAHYQHAFWRNMEPELFAIKPGEAEQRSKRNAVLYGYQQMDRVVGEVIALAGDHASIAFTTGLSQQPCLAYESAGGKMFYKPHDVPALLRFAGIDASDVRIEPVMSEQFHVRFGDEATAMAAKASLDALTVDGRAAMRSRLEGVSIFTGCALTSELTRNTVLKGARGEGSFYDLFYFIEALKSGMHHRDGMFWLREPAKAGRVVPEKLPLTAVMPILMQAMGLAGSSASGEATPRPLAA